MAAASITLVHGAAAGPADAAGPARSIRAWRTSPEAAAVLAALGRFGAGEPLDACAELAALFAREGAAADALVSAFIAAGLAEMTDRSREHLPLRHVGRDAAPAVILAEAGSASLALAVFDGTALDALPPPRSALFQPVETWSRVLGGSGVADLVMRRGGDDVPVSLHRRRVELAEGSVHYRHGSRECLQVRKVAGTMVLLRLQREHYDLEPLREYSLPGGALMHRASARPEDSRRELAIALLGQMDRVDAIPAMAETALGDAPDALRWRALCEVLALDAHAGLDLLRTLAARATDPLAPRAVELAATIAADPVAPPPAQGHAPCPG